MNYRKLETSFLSFCGFCLVALLFVGQVSAENNLPFYKSENTSLEELLNQNYMIPQSVFVVNTTGDMNDALPGDGFCNDGGGNCSLRGAIQEANAFAGANVIDFNLPGGCGQVIAPTTALPAITESVNINGYSQPGALPNTAAVGSNAQICVVLDGSLIGGFTHGLQINGVNTTVRGLNIRRWTDAGIQIGTGNGSVIEGNFIGTDLSGTVAQGNRIGVFNFANSVRIGGTTLVSRNIIGGNTRVGISLIEPSSGNLVQNNYVGVGATSAAVGNFHTGISIFRSSGNTIGGTSVGGRNVVSGNGVNTAGGFDGSGIYIFGDLISNSPNNVVQGNYVGTDPTGAAAIPNAFDGVRIVSSINTIVGGTSAAARNVISGNTTDGVRIENSTATGTLVQGNYLGLTANGATALGNSSDGVEIVDSPNNTIGGTTAGAGNYVSANGVRGIFINGTNATGNLVQGNFVGSNVAGTTGIGNGNSGILTISNNNTIGGTTTGARNYVTSHAFGIAVVFANNNQIQGNYVGISLSGATLANGTGVFLDADNNTIGGSVAGAGNLISGNGNWGIRVVPLSNLSANGNTIQGNRIGTNAAGTSAIPNNLGVLIQHADNTTVGGTTPETRNIISGNSTGGMDILNSSNAQVRGNYIGTTIDGLTALPNQGSGIQIVTSGAAVSNSNVIGGTATGAGNLISGNLQAGVRIAGNSGSNSLQGNIIGLNSAGNVLPNNNTGVTISDGFAFNNTIGGGTANAGNVISGNISHGVLLTTGTFNNIVAGNFIGTNAAGTHERRNSGNGIQINTAPNNTIGGTSASFRNLISGNTSGGIRIVGATATGNQIQGNYIGSNAAGNDYLLTTDGTNVTSNFIYGILVEAPNNTIGGATVAHRNLISGQIFNLVPGILILNSGTGTIVRNNYIGTTVAGNQSLFNGQGINATGSNITIDANLISGSAYGISASSISNSYITNNVLGTNAAQTGFLSNQYSIYLQTASNVRIGEDAIGNVAPNVIAGAIGGNDRAGITIIGNGTGNLIRQNSIYDNAGIGIDLGGDGVTQNDNGDPDLANNLQNFPVLTNVMTTIDGTLNSTPNRSFRIEFYSSPSADGSGYGEGKTFITNTVISTNGSGNATFSIPNPIPVGGFISATATDLSTNDTSEFSALKQVLAPTAVRFAGAKAVKFNNGVLLEWQTGFESDNLGFNVWREREGKRELINNSLVAGSALMTQAKLQSGFDYRWFDANGTKDTVYYVEAIDLNGSKELFGAFNVEQTINQNFGETNSILLSELSKSDAERSIFVEEKANSQDKPNNEQIQMQNALTRFDGVRLAVKNSGFYRVSATELFANGLPANANPNFIKLFADGVEQPINITVSETGTLEAVEFYGIEIDSSETNLRNYLLISSDSQGRRIERSDLQGAPSNQTFYTANIERKDRMSYFAGLLNGDEENFFGATINNVGTEQILTISNLVQTGNAEIFVKLQGLTRTSHNVQVEINGQFAGNISFEAMLKGTLETQIPTNLLHEGANTIRLTALGGGNDLSLVEDIRVSFPRELRAQNNQIRFSAESGQEITVSGFSTKAVRVFDVTDANNVSEIGTRLGRNQDVERSFTIGFTPNANGTRKILMTGNVSSLAEIAPNYSSDLRGANGADLLIVTKREFFKSFNPLIKQRQNQGVRVLLADAQDIYGEFNFGQKSSQAVKNFLQFANTNWERKPRFVIFAGDATYDPKRYLGGNSDIVPTRLVDTLTMETASDEWFGDFNGDNVAEFAIGRLPAQNVSEISAMVTKIVGYDAQNSSNSATFVSDISDGFDFAGANSAVRQILPQNINAVNIERGATDDQTTRSNILNAINSGQKILTFVGHGSTGIWRGNIFTKTDAENLTNAGKLPIFVTMTCLNGYFQDALNTGMGETLVKNPNGGAIAVWTSSGAGLPDSYGSLNVEIHRQLLSGATLGEAHLQAKRTISNQDVLRTFVLLGDPSMRLR